MSTPAPLPTVQAALLQELHQDVLPALEQLVAELPDALTDVAPAERRIRAGALAAARLLLAAWGQVADPAAPRPDCPHCHLPMRHKGSKRGKAITTLGTVAFRRTRYRCEVCGAERYPHDAQLRFLSHAVSWPLAEVL